MQAIIYWIEEQSTTGIAVITLLLTYGFAVIVFGVATILSRRGVGEELKSISPVTLTPLAVILGLMLAFLAARVWENVGHAQEYVGREVGAISEAALLANAFPADVRAKLRANLRKHVEFIETEDWPAMGRFAGSLRTEPVGLTGAIATVLSLRRRSRSSSLRSTVRSTPSQKPTTRASTGSGSATTRSRLSSGPSSSFWPR